MNKTIYIMLVLSLSLVSTLANAKTIVQSGSPDCPLSSVMNKTLFQGDSSAYYCLQFSLAHDDYRYYWVDEAYFFYSAEAAFQGNRKAFYNMYMIIKSFYKKNGLEMNESANEFADYFLEKSKEPYEIGEPEHSNDSVLIRGSRLKIAYRDLYLYMNKNRYKFGSEYCAYQAYFFYSLVMATKYNYGNAYDDMYSSFIIFYNLFLIDMPPKMEELLVMLLEKGVSLGSDRCRYSLKTIRETLEEIKRGAKFAEENPDILPNR